MKHLLIALALFLGQLSFISPAYAESWVIFSSKAWTVRYNDMGDGHPWCAAQSVWVGDTTVSLHNGGAGPVLGIYHHGMPFEGLRGPVDIWIDRRASWVGQAEGTGNSLFFEGPKKAFVAELYYGQRIYFDLDRDGYAEYIFPLQGSAAALHALADCIRKLP